MSAAITQIDPILKQPPVEHEAYFNRLEYTSGPAFIAFPKIPRLFRDMVVTEKIDGTNAAVVVTEGEHKVYAQSRKRLITPEQDNFGFAAWVAEHEDELRELGAGHHYGEWYGKGIQRGYGLDHKRFALFNVSRWEDERPACCDVVPVLARWTFSTQAVANALSDLQFKGSQAAPGFMQPEGVIVYHTAANRMFKALLENDDEPKGAVATAAWLPTVQQVRAGVAL